MPSIKLAQPVDKTQIQAILQRRCPDLDLGTFGPNVTAAASFTVGSWVSITKKQLQVAPMPAGPGPLAVMLLICLTGIGLIYWAVAVIPKQRKLAERVHAALASELAG